MDPAIGEAIAEVQQPRSRFVFERFVLGQHRTPEMRFYQLCLEIQDTTYRVRVAELEVRKTEMQIDRLRASGDAIDEIDADIKSVGLAQTRLVMLGARRELAVMCEIFDESERFTRAQIEAAQPEYWAQRLTRDLELQAMGAAHGVNAAHLDSADQAGVLTQLLPSASATGLQPADDPNAP